MQWHPIKKMPKELLEYSHPKMREYIESLVATAEAIIDENVLLQKEVNRLKGELRVYKLRLVPDLPKKEAQKDTHNSHEPPSSDGPQKNRRTRSQREKSLRKPGGQKGHSGHNLELAPNPDRVKRRPLKECSQCHHSLLDTQPIEVDRRQVFDIIVPRMEVTEYQTEKKICPHCKTLQQSKFPLGITADTQ